MQETLAFYTWYIIIGGLLLCLVWELFLPRRKLDNQPGYRWLNNGALTVINIGLGRWLNTLLLMLAASLGHSAQVGLFVDLPLLPATAMAFLAFELVDYWLHRAYHKVPVLWRLHVVHHSDTDVDFSSAYRHHPLETVLSLLLNLPVVLLLGLPAASILIYYLFRVFVALFSHSNIYLPRWLDRPLTYLLVTPDFHRVHHCSDRFYTDSNFAASMPWFDFLFGTAKLRPFSDHEQFQLGLEYFRSPHDSRLDRLLLMPFTGRRGGVDNVDNKAPTQVGPTSQDS